MIKKIKSKSCCTRRALRGKLDILVILHVAYFVVFPTSIVKYKKVKIKRAK